MKPRVKYNKFFINMKMYAKLNILDSLTKGGNLDRRAGLCQTQIWSDLHKATHKWPI